MGGIVRKITATEDNGNGYICDIEGETEKAFFHYQSDVIQGDTVSAALTMNRLQSPKWFVAGYIKGDVNPVELNGVHDGADDYLFLLSKARMCQKIIAVNGNKIWYAPLDADLYVEEYLED